ncbi:acyl-CoA synthetase family member 3, mitochondrial-like isoform X1 [Centruroides sculpturatus]|uniref:acyl-CoA synthetase family member 3, mitochondrial-like isoform X1 n=2 Tax=Centruroides sculpturatus TaxID=218467 RepID=UPI000C6D15A5|nr:acyl-CoA synthetase family member 3, mitochondrial-like isoform X1 [Centruroides sculpturatus]
MDHSATSPVSLLKYRSIFKYIMSLKMLYRVSLSKEFRTVLRQIHFNNVKFGNLGVLSYVTAKRLSFVPFYERALQFPERLAIVDRYGKYTYRDILHQSIILSQRISDLLKERGKSSQERISFLCQSDASYIVAKWACWITQNVAVPLSKVHPTPQLQYYVENSQSSAIMVAEDLRDKVDPISKQLNVPILEIKHPKDIELDEGRAKDLSKFLPETDKNIEKSNALILYTSGTTGPPKGVVLTHENVFVQTKIPVESWEHTKEDVILNSLPLHHTHGIFYALLCPLYIGSCVVMLPKFDPIDVWNELLNISDEKPQVNCYMAVPTMYVKLIEAYNQQFYGKMTSSVTPEYVKAICLQKIRLMASGSAAMPQPVMERWEEITGHRLLERYGMTEIGMTLSNPLHGERIPGCVGKPVKGTKVCIRRSEKDSKDGDESGELCVKGNNVFKEYWNKPKETKESFTEDGWFKTGDTVECKNGIYKILGRSSTDIIKSGGYKISALDVERHLLSHSNIRECTVLGVPDDTWGERVAAVIVTKDKSEMPLPELRNWCKERMSPYSAPTLLLCLKELPRNALGKVNKKELLKQIYPEFKKQLI